MGMNVTAHGAVLLTGGPLVGRRALHVAALAEAQQAAEGEDAILARPLYICVCYEVLCSYCYYLLVLSM